LVAKHPVVRTVIKPATVTTVMTTHADIALGAVVLTRPFGGLFLYSRARNNNRSALPAN
jgi:hypothetical protein